uniref:Uncharacterized protein n=1 Tax=Cacopsylla melanoneura TaxID=428564 RepID=A0A8D8W0X7_9HEMI
MYRNERLWSKHNHLFFETECSETLQETQIFGGAQSCPVRRWSGQLGMQSHWSTPAYTQMVQGWQRAQSRRYSQDHFRGRWNLLLGHVHLRGAQLYGYHHELCCLVRI